MAQQTAVEWLVQELKDKGHALITTEGVFINVPNELFEQAKAMEKQQIMKAVDRGYDEGCKFPEDMTLKSAEQYYNETYG